MDRVDPGGQDQNGGHEDDPFEDLVLDDDFVRGATHKEASARARMLAAKWRDNPPDDAGSREPARRRRWRGRRAGPAVRPGRPRARDGGAADTGKDRTNLRIAVVFVLCAVLMLGISQRDRVAGWFGGGKAHGRPHPTAPASTAPGSPAPSPGTPGPSARVSTPTPTTPAGGPPTTGDTGTATL